MQKIELVEKFPSIAGRLASVFRYDRWQKILLLSILRESAEDEDESYIVLGNCEYMQFKDELLKLDLLKIVNNDNNLIVKNSSEEFIVKCSSVNLWDVEEYDAYFDELIDSVGDELRYVTMRPIDNIRDLEEN